MDGPQRGKTSWWAQSWARAEPVLCLVEGENCWGEQVYLLQGKMAIPSHPGSCRSLCPGMELSLLVEQNQQHSEQQQQQQNLVGEQSQGAQLSLRPGEGCSTWETRQVRHPCGVPMAECTSNTSLRIHTKHIRVNPNQTRPWNSKPNTSMRIQNKHIHEIPKEKPISMWTQNKHIHEIPNQTHPCELKANTSIRIQIKHIPENPNQTHPWKSKPSTSLGIQTPLPAFTPRFSCLAWLLLHLFSIDLLNAL